MDTDVLTSPEVKRDACPKCSSELKGAGKRRYCEVCGAEASFLRIMEPVAKDSRLGNEQVILQGLVSQLAPQRWIEAAKASDQTEQGLAKAFQCLLELATRQSLPPAVIDEAGRLIKEAFKAKLTRGQSTETLVTSLVYAAARRKMYALTLDELAASLHEDKRELSRCFRKVSRTLCNGLPPPAPEAYLSKTLGALGFGTGDHVSTEAMRALRALVESKFTQGRNPAAISAALIYMTAKTQGVELTQRTVARESFITETTIRAICREITSTIPGFKFSA